MSPICHPPPLDNLSLSVAYQTFGFYLFDEFGSPPGDNLKVYTISALKCFWTSVPISPTQLKLYAVNLPSFLAASAIISQVISSSSLFYMLPFFLLSLGYSIVKIYMTKLNTNILRNFGN